MPIPELILASSSPYRKSLLDRLGLPFTSSAPEVDESPQAGETAAALASRLSLAKARALSNRYPSALIIGSDQVAECKGRLLGKPGTTEAARDQLSFCSGETVTFHTGLCLFNSSENRFACQRVEYQIEFLALTAQQIAFYVETEQPLDCAGSFKSEGLGSALFARHQGDDPTALVGLPLIALCQLLRAEGLDPLAANR